MKKNTLFAVFIIITLLLAACGGHEAQTSNDRAVNGSVPESSSIESGDAGSIRERTDGTNPAQLNNSDKAASKLSAEYKQALELMKNYEYKLIEAINKNDFSLVEPYLLPDSSLYKSQKKLVEDMNQKGIKEEMVSYDVGYLTNEAENTYKIEAVESVSIDYPDKGKETREFQWLYTIGKAGESMKLSGIEAWSTYKEDLLQRQGRAKADGYYASELLYGFDGFLMDELNGNNTDLTDKYVSDEEVKKELASLIKQIKEKGGNFAIVASNIVDEKIVQNSLEPVAATKRMTIGFTDGGKNAKEIGVKLTLVIQEYRLDSKLIFSGYAELIQIKDVEIGPVSEAKPSVQAEDPQKIIDFLLKSVPELKEMDEKGTEEEHPVFTVETAAFSNITDDMLKDYYCVSVGLFYKDHTAPYANFLIQKDLTKILVADANADEPVSLEEWMK